MEVSLAAKALGVGIAVAAPVGPMSLLCIQRTLERGLVGNVYLGKVARVLPGMQSAFIELGLERAAFLHVADLHAGGRSV